ncbi:ArdC-like ssDNA-binding domain-containing protein [Desulfotruncus arcticus]|uniref:ArdC-like ssDNA-binding domain-containing protein n=1 Tax=Desulfotruncus arcticus TaxID=341036 RepID=UPI000AC632A9|nr:ArdC family protein [Desulfotruncus arcticus]
MATVYQIVTNEIIKKLEAGTIPWRKPWRDAGAVNWKTQKPYRGINAILLDPGEYLTFKQGVRCS